MYTQSEFNGLEMLSILTLPSFLSPLARPVQLPRLLVPDAPEEHAAGAPHARAPRRDGKAIQVQVL